MKELKPCPFCGNSNLSVEPISITFDNNPEMTYSYTTVVCRYCGVVGPETGSENEEEEGKSLWEKRA